jgi:hypothetical protein
MINPNRGISPPNILFNRIKAISSGLANLIKI